MTQQLASHSPKKATVALVTLALALGAAAAAAPAADAGPKSNPKPAGSFPEN